MAGPQAKDLSVVTVTDVAEEVVEVGEGVKEFEVGDKVVSILSHVVSKIFIPSILIVFL